MPLSALPMLSYKSESEVAQSCPTLSDPMDCSPPGSSIHGIFQARVLEWGAIAFSGRLRAAAAAAVTSVVSDSVRRRRRQPTRLPRPWDSPGKNTAVGCHVRLQGVKVKRAREVAQSCPTVSDPVDCGPPGSSRPWDFPGKRTAVGRHGLPRIVPYNNNNAVH